VANTIIRAEQIVEAALLLLQREIVLPATVWRQADADFVGAKDDTITLRVPAAVASRKRTMRANTALVEDEFAETSVPVQLTDHIYSLLKLRDEDLTLSITDFTRQVLQPQIRAVAEGLEDLVADAFAAATVGATQEVEFDDSDDVYNMLVDCGAKLDHLKISKSERVFACGTNIAARFLKLDKLVKVNESGQDSALRDGIILRTAGFTVLSSLAFGANEGYAYHRTAVALGNVAPALPEGATMKSRLASDGLSMRYLRDYNPTATNGPVDRSLVDMFAGAASVEQGGVNKRLIKVEYTGTGPISE
jgi:hypothetical protein